MCNVSRHFYLVCCVVTHSPDFYKMIEIYLKLQTHKKSRVFKVSYFDISSTQNQFTGKNILLYSSLRLRKSDRNILG